MPRPQHGPPCGLFINNACECIYIHKQEHREGIGGGGGRGNRDAVSDLHMANKTVSHFGQLQSQNGWQRAQAAEEEEEKPKSRRQQNKTKCCTLREKKESVWRRGGKLATDCETFRWCSEVCNEIFDTWRDCSRFRGLQNWRNCGLFLTFMVWQLWHGRAILVVYERA